MTGQEKWKVDDNQDLPLAVIEDTEYGFFVCEVGSHTAKKSEASPKQLADARLIAAAPFQHSSLEKIMKLADKALKQNETQRGITLNEIGNIAEAAIGKAKPSQT